MCCTGAKWKREVVPDHKFDFIDVREFHDTGCFTRLTYTWVWTLVIKSFLVYVADAYTAIAMLASGYWSGSLLSSDAAKDSTAIQIPFNIGKWIFCGCIIFGFLLLLWEARKSRNIIKSRDISYAYTNVMANNYYSLKSYNHFCFFCQINNSRKTTDEFAFFVFFTFKGWKRLLLADAPRQVINGLTLYSFGKAFNFTTDVSVYIDGSVMRGMVLITMIFTVVVWIGSFILLCIAALMYVPLLCYIQGNLKEFCCHKIDKRIAELMKKKTRKRLLKEQALARKEAAGDYSHLKGKDGKLRTKPMAQPTLPQIDLGDDRESSTVGYNNYGRVGSDLSMRPSNQHAMYPPMPPQNWAGRYQQGEPRPYQYNNYSTSDFGGNGGYEASIHSVDRLMHTSSTPDLNYEYSSKAPSYRSQASYKDEKQGWQDDPNAPPIPQTYGQYNEKSGYTTPTQDEKAHYAEDSYYATEKIDESVYYQQQTYQQPQHARRTESFASVEQYQPVNRQRLLDQTAHPLETPEMRPESEFFGYYTNESEYEPTPPSRQPRR